MRLNISCSKSYKTIVWCIENGAIFSHLPHPNLQAINYTVVVLQVLGGALLERENLYL